VNTVMFEARVSTATGPKPPVAATAALWSLTAVAWVVLVSGVSGHMSHDELLGTGHLPEPGAVLAFLGAWQVMVIATMLPAAIPAITARIRRYANASATATAGAIAVSILAVCAVWTGFAVAVLAGDSVLHRLVNAIPWLADHEWLVMSATLITAGIIQLSPLGRPAFTEPSTKLGPFWQDALSCLRDCWLLMVVMFAIALDNLLVMAALTPVMALQHAPRLGSRLVSMTALVLIGAGVLISIHGGGLV
jgi:predicted metal-binding membrane protein